MNPLFFGDSKRPLFGVYHPPRGRQELGGVVLCYPVGQEYMRAHRAFRQLAMLLSKAGFHVLRFDYFGTGDSGGESDEGSVPAWVDDICTAVDELRDTSGVKSVSLVGLRIGGALAALAGSRRAELDRVLLWDPVVQGKEYVRALLESGAVEHAGPEETVGVSGFPYTPRLRAELAEIDLLGLPASKRVTLVVSDEKDDYLRLRDAGRSFGYRHIPSAGNWDEADKYGAALLPQAIIQGIVSCLAEKDAR
ncbi:MAG: alpha/beta fold hydrolase [Gemmatimonadetes bacterium]|nr:alpha/beta fold hydrolase [Gemmatimonadota bacterium]